VLCNLSLAGLTDEHQILFGRVTTGSHYKKHGIERGSYGTVISVNHKENQITVQNQYGQQATYDPKRLQGIAAYREISRDFSQGDRLQFTANNRELGVSNRDMER
jgi:hypothetical protein